MLSLSSIKKAFDFFHDDFQEECYIGFYGGEPLLEFETIRRTVDFIENHAALKAKKLRYSISTNGTLLTDEIMAFLNDHKFTVNLSHDGTAQEITRPGDPNSHILENLGRLIRLSGIKLTTNSVFTPATASELFRSARFMTDRGVRNCYLTYSFNDLWDSVALGRLRDELRELRHYLLAHYRTSRTIPVENFQNQPERALFCCTAGQDRLALAADGRLWGCRFFADFFAGREDHLDFEPYRFGDIDEFIAGRGDVLRLKRRNYRKLRMDNFSTATLTCRECDHLLFCDACPATAAFSTGRIGRIPAWQCQMKKIWHEEIAGFWEAVKED